jgi:hypothetical protein
MCAEMISMGERIQLRTATPAQVESIISYALGHGACLVSVNPVRPSLEDHFFKVMSTEY